MEQWISQNNPGKQTILTIASMALGLVLAVGFRDFSGPGMTHAKAGFLLGLMLLAIGFIGFLTKGRQTVVIDAMSRRITVEDNSLFGTKRRAIAFRDVSEVTVGFLGKRSNFVTIYYLVLHLTNGERYPLFAPGRFYDGASDRSVVEGWRARLEKYLAG